MTDRRPIASRDAQPSKSLARWLADGGISANLISVFGMCAALGAGALLGWTGTDPPAIRAFWIGAAVLIQLRLIANMLDGMVAIATATASPLGEIYNELPDRISDTAVLVGLGYAAGGRLELGFAAAVLAMLTAYIRALGKVAGADQHYLGPMAKPHRMFLCTIVCLYIGCTPTAWNVSFESAWLPGLPAWILLVICAGSALTSIRRLRRVVTDLRGTSE